MRQFRRDSILILRVLRVGRRHIEAHRIFRVEAFAALNAQQNQPPVSTPFPKTWAYERQLK